MTEIAIFDTMNYANRLKRVGVPGNQAETHAKLLSEAVINKVITSQYLNTKLTEVSAKFDARLSDLATRMDTKIVEVTAQMDVKIEN